MSLLCVAFCLSATLLGFNPDFCLPNAEPTTPECQWVNYTDGLANDTRLMRVDSNLGTVIIVRSIQNNDVQIESVWSTDYLKNISESPKDTSLPFKRYEVLLIQPDHYAWQSSSNGIIPDNAIEGGQHDNKTVYVCRASSYFHRSEVGMVIIFMLV
ncbi:hypothetical protein PV327_011326 [Microctonus hyperodae]|uniref:Uncharacterized protein n=1 Tax=Microctonus hyperodae TaxID=165561 RepID=A0AA39KRR9_MICHY|nr:hypothetical protein PV327_011326 [Microctonus hyperodae]